MENKKPSFIALPKSVKALAEEIKKAVDFYWNREISEIELKEILWKWATTGKLLRGNDYNPTILRLCGKKRMEVVDKLLEGYRRKV